MYSSKFNFLNVLTSLLHLLKVKPLILKGQLDMYLRSGTYFQMISDHNYTNLSLFKKKLKINMYSKYE